jgi:hypothetical protein
MPATSFQLQPFEQQLFRNGWVASDYPIVDNAVSKLYNFRVEVRGLELVEGWDLKHQVAITDNSLPVTRSCSFISPEGKRFAIFFLPQDIVLVYGDTSPDGIYVANISPLIGTQGWSWSDVAVIGSDVYINGEYGLYKWNMNFTTAPERVQLVTPPSSDSPPIPIGKAIGTLGYRIVLGHIVERDQSGQITAEYPNRIVWSGLNEPNYFDPLAYFDLYEKDEIWRILPLGDNLIIYTSHSAYALSQTGDVVAPFALTHLMENLELINPNCIANVSMHEFRGHVLVTQTGVWVMVGQESQLISANLRPIWRSFVAQSEGNLAVFTDPVNEEVLIVDLKNHKAIVFQTRFRTWYERDFNLEGWGTAGLTATSMTNVGVRRAVVENGTVLQIFKIEGVTRDDEPAEALIQTFVYEVTLPTQEAVLHGGTVYWTTEAAAGGNLIYKVIAGKHINDVIMNLPVIETREYQITIGLPVPYIEVKRMTQRAFRWEMKFTGLTKPLTVHGHVAYFRPPVSR